MGPDDRQIPPKLDYAIPGKEQNFPPPPIPRSMKKQMIWLGIAFILLHLFFIIVALFACNNLEEWRRHLVLKGWFVSILFLEGFAAWALSGRFVYLLLKYRRSADGVMTIMVLGLFVALEIYLGKGVLNDVRVTGRVTSYSGNYYYGLYSNDKAGIATDPISLGFADSYLVISTETTFEGPRILKQAQPGQIAVDPQNNLIYMSTGFEYVVFPTLSYIGDF